MPAEVTMLRATMLGLALAVAAGAAGSACSLTTNLDGLTGGGGGVDASRAEGGDDASAEGPPRDARDETPPDQDATPPGPDAQPPCGGQLGCSCARATDCMSGICGDALALTPQFIQSAGGNVCTRPCCDSVTCDPGFVCYAAATGGDYCVRASLLGRTAIGTGLPGAACATGGDCRSGVCFMSACEDTCCGDASCLGQTACTLRLSDGAANDDHHHAFACAAPPGIQPTGGACIVDSDCKSGLCSASSTCETTCRSDASCPNGLACAYAMVGGTTDFAAVCLPPVGSSALGATCSANAECKSGMCNTVARACTGACFADGDCSAVPGWRCAPLALGQFEMAACQP